MKSALLLGILSVANSAIASIILNEIDRLQAGVAEWDLEDNGNYRYAGCDHEQGQALTQQLDSLYAALIPIIDDTKASATNPGAAYKAFFKSRSNAVFVANLLANVTTGVARRQPRPPISNGNPTFVCLDPARPENNFIRQGAEPRIARPSTTGSTALSKSRRMTTALGPACENIQWSLLEEVVHYYLAAASVGVVSHIPEAYDINEAWALSAADALGNAVSYSYYAGSEFYSILQ
ncbi:MAG: hypothetical protein Q9220_002659 [cf. Caloplaca sp. 1 TL-2023]